MTLATAAAIRDRIATLVTAIVPASSSGDRFRQFRDEMQADFSAFVESNPLALRRFQVRNDGTDIPPDVEPGDVSRRTVTFAVRVSYPLTHRFGNGRSRDDAIDEDWRKINYAIGIYGRANFFGGHDCTPIGATKMVERVGKSDVLVVMALFTYCVAVSSPPIAAFTSSAAVFTVTFTDTSTDAGGSIASWSWDFGDGESSTERNPVHVYDAGGTYTVTLTVTDDEGDTDSYVDMVELGLSLVPFVAGQSNAAGRGSVETVPDYAALGYDQPYAPVQFVDWVEDSPTDPLAWDFERGPQTLRPLPGGNAGIMGVEMSLYRDLVAAGHAVAGGKMGIGSSTLAVHWKAVGSTYPTADPKLITQLLSAMAEAQALLPAGSLELVWIQGESDAGNQTQAEAYAANFGALVTVLRAAFPGLPITLNKLHSSAGGTFNSTVRAQQDIIAATIPGIRMINGDDLDLIGAHFTAPAYKTLGERFSAAILATREFPPVAAFTSSSLALVTTFTDTSSVLVNAITSWSWDFGDGGTSTSQNPSHTFAAGGTYSVTLTVTDSDGRSDSITDDVTVIATLWEVDTTSSIGVPVDSTEWGSLISSNSLAFSAPNNLWLFQESGTTLADAIGGKNLTVTGSPSMQQTASGWTRKSVKASGAAANQFANNATMSNTASVSVLLLVYARIYQATNGSQRAYYGGASSNAFEGVAGSSVARIRVGAQAGNGSLSHVGQVRPYVLKHDVTNSVAVLYSDIEKRSITYAAAAGTTVQFQFGLSTDVTVNTEVLYAAAWNGAAAERSEAEIKAMLEALDWAVTGW